MIKSVDKGHKGHVPAVLRAHRRFQAIAGIALIEILMAVAVLAIGAGSTIWALAYGNRWAEEHRTRNAALALCQERVDQVLAASFRPPGNVPAYFGTWPVPGSDTVTSTETVQLHSAPDGTGIVTGTRETIVSMGDATLGLVRVTARVAYTFRGTNYVVQTFSLRSPD